MARDFAKAFYNSGLWQDVRESILERDSGLCRMCGAVASEVHHVIKLTTKNIDDPEITVNPDNLLSLCGECHKAQHRRDRAAGRCSQPDQRVCAFDADGNPVRRQ